jgi:hypothetical protein
MTVFIDDGENADWIKGRTWEFATDPDAFIAEIGMARLPHFLTLPASRAMPESLRQTLSESVRRVAEALLMEHPGNHDQKVHNPHKISTRAVGEKLLRGKPRVWPPGDPTSMGGLPAAHAAKIRGITKRALKVTDEDLDRNLDAVMQRALKNPEALKGKDWYEEAHGVCSEVADTAGLPVEQGVGMVAALSPQHDWGSNAEAARFVAKTLKEDKPIPNLDDPIRKRIPITDPTDPLYRPGDKPAMRNVTRSAEEWARLELAGKGITLPKVEGRKLSEFDPMTQGALIKAMSQKGGALQYADDITGTSKGVTWSCGLDGISKAVRIYRGESADVVLNGHKVRSFHNNMLSGRANPSADVTIDTHAVSAALGKRYAATSPQIKTFTSGTSLASHGSKGLYPQFADAYRRVAKKYNMPVHEAQAIIWLQWRAEKPVKRK